jgi:DNA invertase Pin-like site-specific DNA recombinase
MSAVAHRFELATNGVVAAVRAAEAISYSRYSKSTQGRGESIKRQEEENAAIAAMLGLPLNTSLVDRGLSAFTGMNRLKGAFASLLAKLKGGLIAPGSVLIVEALDRISREEINEALEQFLHIINSGLAIYTKRDKTLYSRETLRSRDGPRLLFSSIMEMVRANEESAAKGERVRFTKNERRKAALAQGVIATAMAPKWLECVAAEDSTRFWRPIPHRVEVLELIFKWCEAGVGVNTIARRLTEMWRAGDATKAPWGKGRRNENGERANHAWHGAVVHSILTNRAVLGEWQPTLRNIETKGKIEAAGDPIPGYYGDGVIDLQTFQKAANALARNRSIDGKRGVGGRRGNAFPNLFLGVASCAACGSRMTYRFAGRPLLVCDSYRRGGGCRVNTHHRLLEVERAVFDALEGRMFNPGALTQPTTAAAKAIEADHAAATEEVKFLDGRIGEIMRDRTLDFAAIREHVAAMQAEKATALVRQQALAKRLSEERASEGPAAHIQAVRRLRAMATSAEEGRGRYDARARVNGALREIVGDMVFTGADEPLGRGSVTINLPDGIGYVHIARVGEPASVVVHPPELQAVNRDLTVAAKGEAGGREFDALRGRIGAPTPFPAARRRRP